MAHLPNHTRPWMSPNNAREAAREAEALSRILDGIGASQMGSIQSAGGFAAANVHGDGLPSQSQYLQGRATERLAVLAGLMGFGLLPAPDELEDAHGRSVTRAAVGI